MYWNDYIDLPSDVSFTQAMCRKRGKFMYKKEETGAVDECIEEGILSEFLVKNKSEVIAMSIYEYDEKHKLA